MLVDGEEAFFGVEGEVAGAVIGEVVSAVAITDDEKLNEAQKRAGVAVTGVVLVLYDLLHCPAGIDAEGLEFDLHGGHAVDQEENVVAVVAVVGVGAELARDLEAVLAPVLDVDQRVVERGAVVAGEAVYAAEYFAALKASGVMISSRRRWNSPSVSSTRLSASNFSRKLRSSAARSRMPARRPEYPAAIPVCS